SKVKMVTRKKGVENSPVASSQSVVFRSRRLVLHNKQRHYTRTQHTQEGRDEEVRRRHPDTGKKSPHRLCGLLTHRRPVCNHDAALQFVSLQETGERREGREGRCGPHPSRLDVAPVTSSRQITCSKDCRIQQRLVPSFSHRAPLHRRRHPPPPHQHNEGAAADDATRATSTQPQGPIAAAMSKQDWLQDSKRRVSTPSNALASRGKTATDTQGEAP
ncbi:hypothetical protein TcCL_Unassigned02494, partial [Trypanosoma cruzi]